MKVKLAVALVPLLFVACANLKEKCVRLDIGEGGNLNLTAPNTAWFAVNFGSITGTGPVKLESCPVGHLPILEVAP